MCLAGNSKGEGKEPVLHKEDLVFENVKLTLTFVQIIKMKL